MLFGGTGRRCREVAVDLTWNFDPVKDAQVLHQAAVGALMMGWCVHAPQSWGLWDTGTHEHLGNGTPHGAQPCRRRCPGAGDGGHLHWWVRQSSKRKAPWRGICV